MSETIIKFDSVSKSYNIHERNYRSFREEFTGFMKRIAHSARRIASNSSLSAQSTLRSAPSTTPSAQNDDFFWALKNINFEVKRGEALGIIGANGSGKTTILRLLSKVTAPTNGDVYVSGKVAPLIQVGAGFHPELTGRENVYLNATIMGLSKKEIDEKYDDIVEFAELKEFMDTPVKRYSSGMYVRLGFAVIANINPDIFLIDEILSVGDISFQRKCLDTMNKIQKSGKTIIFISHNLSIIKGLCERIIWLDKGNIKKEGDSDDVINAYVSYMTSKSQFIHDIAYIGSKTRWGTGEARFINVEVQNINGKNIDTFSVGDKVTIKLEYEAYKKIENPVFWIGIFNNDAIEIFGSFFNKKKGGRYTIDGKGTLKCVIDTYLLKPGIYYIMAGIYGELGELAIDRIGRACTFKIKHSTDEILKGYNNFDTTGVVYLPHEWELETNLKR